MLLVLSPFQVVPDRILIYVEGLLMMSFLIMTSCNRNAWHHRLLGSRPLAFLGTFSYSIYLIHAPLLQVLWQYAFRPLQSHPVLMLGALVFLGLPIIGAASYGFFLLCERPFLTKRRAPAGKTAILVDPAKIEPDIGGMV